MENITISNLNNSNEEVLYTEELFSYPLSEAGESHEITIEEEKNIEPLYKKPSECNFKKGCYLGVYNNILDKDEKTPIKNSVVFTYSFIEIDLNDKNNVKDTYILYYGYDNTTKRSFVYQSNLEHYNDSILEGVLDDIYNNVDMQNVCTRSSGEEIQSEFNYCNFYDEDLELNREYYDNYKEELQNKIKEIEED